LHVGGQAPQSVHLFRSITAFLLVMVMAAKGQAFTHKEHPTHLS